MLLTQHQQRLLPAEIITAEPGTEFNNTLIKDGKAIPLLALIPVIASAISALTGVGGVVASNIIAGKKNEEQERHNREMEGIATKVSSGTKYDIDESDLINKSIEFLHGKGYIIGIA